MMGVSDVQNPVDYKTVSVAEEAVAGQQNMQHFRLAYSVLQEIISISCFCITGKNFKIQFFSDS